MNSKAPLDSLEITNQCVLVCDLSLWTDRYSAAWTRLSGAQDEVGRELAAMITGASVNRLDDFGGVCESILCKDDEYLEDPPRVKSGAAVFSFTPKKRIATEGFEMARVAALAGYALLILTIQKHEKFGKVWVLMASLNHLDASRITYYEDTNTVVDEIKTTPAGASMKAVHVLTPEFGHLVSRLADRAITQAQYQSEVLLHANTSVGAA